MRKSSICKVFAILAACFAMTAQAQTVSKDLPWSVRMTESEIVRCPESWQLDFQPRLKWDYCHGLDLPAMFDVYDRYQDPNICDYAIASADTILNDTV